MPLLTSLCAGNPSLQKSKGSIPVILEITGRIAYMRLFWVLLSVFSSLSAGLLTAAVVILAAVRGTGGENLVLPAFGLIVLTSAIIYVLIALDTIAFGLWVLARLRLRRRR